MDELQQQLLKELQDKINQRIDIPNINESQESMLIQFMFIGVALAASLALSSWCLFLQH